MALNPAYQPLEPSKFFPDGRSSRHLVPGTVPRQAAPVDWQFTTGLRDSEAGGTENPKGARPLAGEKSNRLRDAWEQIAYVDQFPIVVTPEVLARGQQRYTIFCEVCHDPRGDGQGIVVERGYTRPPSYNTDRLRSAPVGYFFDVMTRGFGSMPQYAKQLSPEDRWAVAAYLRALQLSQHAPLADLPESVQKAALSELEKPRGS